MIPIPSSVMIALVAGGTLNSSAANFRTAVKGVFSGTERLKTFKKNCNYEMNFCEKSEKLSKKLRNILTLCRAILSQM